MEKTKHHTVSDRNIAEWLIQNIYTTEDLRRKCGSSVVEQYLSWSHGRRITIKRGKEIADGDTIEFNVRTSVGPFNLSVINKLTFQVNELDSFTLEMELTSNEIVKEQ